MCLPIKIIKEKPQEKAVHTTKNQHLNRINSHKRPVVLVL